MKDGILSEGKKCAFLNVVDTKHRLLYIATYKVKEAVKENKIFTVYGNYPIIREALRQRGWIEQTPIGHVQRDKRVHGHYEELHKLMSSMVILKKPKFYWNGPSSILNELKGDQMCNHFRQSGCLSTKRGLNNCLRNLHWFDNTDVDSFFPRCYWFGDMAERECFIEDFMRTACSSLLQHVVEHDKSKSDQSRNLTKGLKTVPSSVIVKALRTCQNYLDSTEHLDIDVPLESTSFLSERQWSIFLKDFYLVVQEGYQIVNIDLYVDRCRDMLQKIWHVDPQMVINGTQNMWIVKPESMSQGRGITCHKKLENILEAANNRLLTTFGKTQVVQKYIERPFLVHGTKVDVRQWFLVSSLNPLTVWFYKKAYVRFSTQPYSLKRLDRSVHLCNNSLHKHLKPSPKLAPEIPQDSTWCCHQFETFLQAQGKGGLWKEKVVPEMKRAIIRAMLTAQDHLESRSNSFELYGADFVLGEDLHPWFIEVNSRPSLSGNTAVKSRLCAAVQRDTLKVVLDRKHDPTADTGHFDMIFQQEKFKVPKLSRNDLQIKGDRYFKHPMKKQNCPKKISSTPVKPMAFKQGLKVQNTASKYSAPSSRPQIGSHPCLSPSAAQQREGTTTFRARHYPSPYVWKGRQNKPLTDCRVTREPAFRPQRTSQESSTAKVEHFNTGVINPRPPFTPCKNTLCGKNRFIRLKLQTDSGDTSSTVCNAVTETADVKRLQRSPQILSRTEMVSTQKLPFRSASCRVEADDKLPRLVSLDRTSAVTTAALCTSNRSHWK